MNRCKCRWIAVSTVVSGLLSLVAMPSARAQLLPDARPAVRTPPPNPQPPNPLPPAMATPGNSTSPATVEPGYLGVVADDRQEKGAGVRVVEIETGGPAEQGGLKADDLITSINGAPVHGQSDMGPVLERLTPGSKVKFVVDRGGQQQTVEVTLGNRPPAGQRRYEKFGVIPEPLPEPNTGAGQGPDTSGIQPGPIPTDAAPNGLPPLTGPGGLVPGIGPDQPNPGTSVRLPPSNLPGTEPTRRPLLGVRTRSVTEEARQRLRLPATAANGALVVSRTVGSPAVQAGIPLDAVITAVDGKPIGSPQDLTQIIVQAGAGREIEITYFYGGTMQRAKVRLAEFAAGPSGLLGNSSLGAGDLPLPPNPQPSRLPMPDDKTRIDALERRVQQLEHRVDDLEQALNKSK
jgi:S1-C subfamily serine protease